MARQLAQASSFVSFAGPLEDCEAALTPVSGVVWVEGHNLPPPPELEVIVEAAFRRALSGSALGPVPPPLVRLSGARASGPATVRFAFEVLPGPAGSSSSSADDLASVRAVLASRLQSEAVCRGAALLLPTLVEFLEVAAPAVDKCRLRLELDEAVGGTLPMENTANAPFCSRVRLDGVGRSAGAVQPSSRLRDESPTAWNLERDPALKARVLAGALPLSSPMGQAMAKQRQFMVAACGQGMKL